MVKPNVIDEFYNKGFKGLKAMNIRRYMGIRLTPDKLLFGLDEPPQMYNRLIYTWDTLFYEMGLSPEDKLKSLAKTW